MTCLVFKTEPYDCIYGSAGDPQANVDDGDDGVDMELDLTQGRGYSEAANGSTSAGRHTPTSAVYAPMAMGAGSTGIQTLPNQAALPLFCCG